MSDLAGPHSLLGVLFGTVDAAAAAGQNAVGDVVYNIAGVLSTFDITSAANTTVVVNQLVDILDTLDLSTGGGTISLGTGLTIGEAVNATISGGGDFVVTSTLLGFLNRPSTVTFTGTGGTLTVGSAGRFSGAATNAPISGFIAPSDVIDNVSLSFSGITGYSIAGTPSGAQTVTVDDSAGNYTFTLTDASLTNGTYTPASDGPLTFSADKTKGTDIASAVCFLRGTRLATLDGETAVEAIRAGDLVATRAEGRTVFRPVTWVGRRTIDVRRHASAADLYPVRIRAGAFAESVPHRDLLVTAEHCVHVDGRLVPARMLVNGGSIIVDTSIPAYEFFHVELADHAILIAEGLETESYLDTGNRGNFVNVGQPRQTPSFAVDSAAAIWVTRAAAPLAVDRATVEPIWQRLAARSSVIGRPIADAPLLETDPQVHLLADTGVRIWPRMVDGRSHVFALPGDVRSVRLISKASRPSETAGPFVDDRRDLGVLVGAIGYDDGQGRRAVSLAATMDGWHAAEPGCAQRWTSGEAALPLDLVASRGGSVMVDIEIVSAGPYLLRPAMARAA